MSLPAKPIENHHTRKKMKGRKQQQQQKQQKRSSKDGIQRRGLVFHKKKTKVRTNPAKLSVSFQLMYPHQLCKMSIFLTCKCLLVCNLLYFYYLMWHAIIRPALQMWNILVHTQIISSLKDLLRWLQLVQVYRLEFRNTSVWVRSIIW